MITLSSGSIEPASQRATERGALLVAQVTVRELTRISLEVSVQE